MLHFATHLIDHIPGSENVGIYSDIPMNA